MDLVFEFLLELIFEGAVEVSKSKKIPKIIRYPLICLIVLFFIALIGLMFFVSYLVFQESIVGGICFFLFSFIFLVMGIFKFKNLYLVKFGKK